MLRWTCATVLIFFSLSETLESPHVKKLANVSTDNVFSEAAVVTNSEVCTNIALGILAEEGSAADAAIAALLCEGVTNPQSMGIGGGFLLTIYSSASKRVEVLNAREAAPLKSKADMFGSMSENDRSSGGLSVAVPGELKGYWALHKKYGRMAWDDLFRPTIELCRTGIAVTEYTGRMIAKVKDEILQSPTIKELLTNTETNRLYREGELMMRPQLAETLEQVAKYGPDALYHGNLTADFLYDIEDNGGILTRDDLMNYTALWETPYQHQIGNYMIHTVPPPGSGNLLIIVLEVMTKKMCNKDELYWHRLIETWKFAFGIRSGITAPNMGQACLPTHIQEDVELILKKMTDCHTFYTTKDYCIKNRPVEDHGSSHISILAPNGDAIAVTSTINLSFGALFVSQSTGIILNNEMIDFSIPKNSKSKKNSANSISPKRQPMSTMMPTIVTNINTQDVRLVIGSSGGFKILTSTSAVMLNHLYMGIGLHEAVTANRLHPQLLPMVVEYEEGFSNDVLESLMKLGHRIHRLDAPFKTNSSASMAMHSCVNAIGVIGCELHAVADWRRKAYAGGY